jgi:hypothetical protein
MTGKYYFTIYCIKKIALPSVINIKIITGEIANAMLSDGERI